MYDIFCDTGDENQVKSKSYASPSEKGKENESNAYKKRIENIKPRNRNFPGWAVLPSRSRTAEIVSILF